ncbi:MAG: hypothetical protein HHJ12_15445 [Glaciimonas sp.]|nr:hypothetical protein [Glaciimonas sp.]
MLADSNYTTLKLATDGRGVSHVTLAKPETLSAFDETMIAKLSAVFDAGIAQVAAAAGHLARLMDARPDAARAAHDNIGAVLSGLVGKRRLSGLEQEAILARIMPADTLADLAHTKRSLNHWLRAAWPAFEASLNAEIMGFAAADAREGLAAIKEKRAPQLNQVAR